MKEIKKEKTTTQTYTEYEAIDGTTFRNMEECRSYEDTAKCVLRARVKRLIVTKEHDAWSLMGGYDDNSVIGMRFQSEDDITTFLQYMCLQTPFYTKEAGQDTFKKISDKCHAAMTCNDLLLVGINCDEDYYIINTVQNIIDNLLHIEDNEKTENPS